MHDFLHVTRYRTTRSLLIWFARHRAVALYCAGLLGVLGAGAVAFSELGGALFFSWDSASQIAFANEALANGAPLSLGPSYTQSLGNLAFPIDYWLMPDYRLAFHDGRVNPVIFYLVVAGLFFTCAFGMAALFRFGPWLAAISASLFTLLTLPYSSPAIFTELFWWHAPFMDPLIYMGTPLLALYYVLGRQRGWHNAAIALLLFLTVIWISAAYPKLSAVIFLGAAVFCLVFTIGAEDRRELAWKLGGALAVTALFLLIGPWPFMRGVYGYTGNFLYLETMKPGGGIDWQNLLRTMFYPPSIWFGNIEPNLVWVRSHMGYVLPTLAIVGAIRAMISPRWPRPAKLLALGVLVTLPFSFASVYGSAHPAQVQYLLFLFALIPVAEGVRHLRSHLPRIDARWRKIAGSRWQSIKPIRRLFLGRTVAGFALLVFATGVFLPRPAIPYGYPYPPAETDLVRFLRARIAFGQNDPFEGRYLNLLLNEQLDEWPESSHLHTTAMAVTLTSADLARREGNDLTFAGPRHAAIPVTIEYNRMTTPFSAVFHNYLLVRDGDMDRIDYRTITRFDPRLLALIGVRYVLSGKPPLGAGAHVALETPLRSRSDMHLYEIDRPNRGQFAPVRLHRIDDIGKALEMLADPAFDPRTEALIHTALSQPASLRPADTVTIRRHNNGLHVKAAAPGWSYLVLPFEFSHCLRIDGASPRPPASIARTNLFLTGVLFDGEADFDLRFDFGPFKNANCRLLDMADVRAMNLSRKTLEALGAGYRTRLRFNGLS